MPKKETEKGRICRLMRGAFNKANAGDEIEARRLWKLAIKAGFKPYDKITKGLEVSIRIGNRNLNRAGLPGRADDTL